MADSVDDSCELIEKSSAPRVTTFQRVDLNGTSAGDQYGGGGDDAGVQRHNHPTPVSVIARSSTNHSECPSLMVIARLTGFLFHF